MLAKSARCNAYTDTFVSKAPTDSFAQPSLRRFTDRCALCFGQSYLYHGPVAIRVIKNQRLELTALMLGDMI
jgi:hypothetical protein